MFAIAKLIISNSYIVTIILVISLISCTDNTSENSVSSSESVRDVDKIRLTDLDGKSLSLKQYIGKTIFINLWATWCKSCIHEMPYIQEAQSILQDENVIFLMASGESAEEIEEFINNNSYNFNYVRIENSEEMNVQALPTTFIFNRHGDLVYSEAGSRKWNNQNNIDLILKIAKE